MLFKTQTQFKNKVFVFNKIYLCETVKSRNFINEAKKTRTIITFSNFLVPFIICVSLQLLIILRNDKTEKNYIITIIYVAMDVFVVC